MENNNSLPSTPRSTGAIIALIKRFVVWIVLPIFIVTALEISLFGKEFLGILQPASLFILLAILLYIPIISTLKVQTAFSKVGKFIQVLLLSVFGYVLLVLVFFGSAELYEQHLLKGIQPDSGVSKSILGHHIYENKSLRYKISYPKNFVAFTELDASNNKIIAPNVESPRVLVGKNDEMLFCCESALLEFRAATKTTDLYKAMEDHIKASSYDMSGTAEPIMLNGKPGLLMKGTGSINIPYRVIVVSTGRDTPLIIVQGIADESLESIVNKISFQ